MNKDQLIEALADIEHQRWSDWQEYLHEGCWHDDYGNAVIDAEKYNHWQRLIATPYADLPEHSKQSDREQVMRYWPLLVEFVAEWLSNYDGPAHSAHPDIVAREWREEMVWEGRDGTTPDSDYPLRDLPTDRAEADDAHPGAGAGTGQ